MDTNGLNYLPFTDENDFISAVNKANSVLQNSVVTQPPPSSTSTLVQSHQQPTTEIHANQNSNSTSSDIYDGSSNSISPCQAGKKRDWSKVVRKFHQEWTEQFAVVERNQKPFCLICQKLISQMKVHTIRQHYQKLHGDFEHRFGSNSEARTLELNRLNAIVPYSFNGEYRECRVVMDFKEEVPEDEDDQDDEEGSGDDLEAVLQQTTQLLEANNLEYLQNSGFESTNDPSTSDAQFSDQLNSSSGSLTISLSLADIKKRRDWTKVVRKFHHQWTGQYLVIESVQHQKPLCLICHKMISAMKVHNIKRHYMQLHSAYFDHHFPAGSLSRKTELSRLIEEFRKNTELNNTFISILSTPDLYENELEAEDEASDEYEEVGTSNGGSGSGSGTSTYQIAQQNSSTQQHQVHYQQLKNSGLTRDKMERAFSHLDKFLAIIEQNDPNMQRSFKVRTAIEVVVDCYKHLLKDMKHLGGRGGGGGENSNNFTETSNSGGGLG